MLFSQTLAHSLQNGAQQDAYLAASLEAFQKTVLTETELAARLTELENAKTRSLEEGGESTMRFGDKLRALAEQATRQALAYALSQQNQTPPNPHYANARRIALRICAETDWVIQGKLGNPFRADLWTADIAMQIAMVLDTFRETLPPEERKTIEQAILHKGVDAIYDEWVNPATRRHVLDSMGHNWWSVIVAGGCAALSVLGDACPDGAEKLQEMQDGLLEWFRYPGNLLQNKKANFGDGDFVEFLGYLAYALSNYAIFEKRHGVRLLPESELARLPDFYIAHFQNLEEGFRLANFGDSPFNMTNAPYFLLYMAERFDRPDLLYCIQNMRPSVAHPFDLACYPVGMRASAEIRTPKTQRFQNAGYAVLRSGYGREDWFFAMKTGESWNHNHRDVGSFILSARGQQIAIDSGTCAYGRKEYIGYFTCPEAHNIVLYEGEGQHPDAQYIGTKYAGTFPTLFETEAFSYLLADCCGPYSTLYRRFYRHVLFLNGVILFVDDIQTNARDEDGALDWLLHYAGTLAETETGYVLTNGGHATRILPLYPEMRGEVRRGYQYEDVNLTQGTGPLEPADYLALRARTQNQRAKLVTAIVLDEPQNEGVRIETRRERHAENPADRNGETSALEIRIQRGETLERVILNERADGSVMHANTHCAYGGLYTDAFISYLQEDAQGTVRTAAMLNGSRLQVGEDFLCSSLLKHDVCIGLDARSVTANVTSDTRLTVRAGEWRARFTLSRGMNQKKGW